MNKHFLIILLFILFLIIYFNQQFKEHFSNQQIIKPSAIAILKNGSVSNVIMTNKGLFNKNYYQIIVSGGLTEKNFKQPILKFVEVNNDIIIKIIDTGYGYIIPPNIDFVPNIKIREPKQLKQLNKNKALDFQQYYSQYMWNSLQNYKKDDIEVLTESFLRTRSYASVKNSNLVNNARIIKKDNLIRYEFLVPIELIQLNFVFYSIPKQNLNKSFIVKGYNSNNVELFQKQFIFDKNIQWNLFSDNVYLIQYINVETILPYDNIEIIGKECPLDCEELEDLLEQIKTALKKPKPKELQVTPSMDIDLYEEEYEKQEEKTEVYWEDVLQQIPNEYHNRSRKFLTYYYQRLLEQCKQLNSQQQKDIEIMENAENSLYKEQFKTKLQLLQEQRQKMIEEYLKMKAQYEVDLLMIEDAKKYKIKPPPPKYTWKQIEDKRKLIEKIQSMPDDLLLNTCSRIDRNYQKKRKSAEKWAQASIFIPFLKGKAKKVSRQAEKYENQYAEMCADFVDLDFPDTNY